jgi:hypothetical protein
VPYIPADNRYQQLRTWLKSRSEFDYIDGQDVLAECRGLQIFFKFDIHMMLPGGVCFAKALIGRMAKDEGRSESPWDHTFKYTEATSIHGGQADFMSLLVPMRQTVYSPDHTYFSEKDPTFFTDPAGIFEWQFHAPPGSVSGLLPPVVLFGDSFLDLYRVAGIQSYLSSAYRARDNNSNLTAVLIHLPTDTRYFVFEFLEPWANMISGYKIPAVANAAEVTAGSMTADKVPSGRH